MRGSVPPSWDVIVAGAGPGGALAARRCAGNGLRTLLLEKRRMPRDKCCSGMVMGEWGQDILREEFGEYPDEVLSETIYLRGYALHVPGASLRTLDIDTPTTWRRTLDSWMCRCAQEAGATLWDSAQVMGVTALDGSCSVDVRKAGRRIELDSEFVIGADGGSSWVRRALFPELEPVALHGYRECYETVLDLPSKRFNIFVAMAGDPMFFAHQKGSYLLLEGVAFPGGFKQALAHARRFLVENHGLDPDLAPLWRDGCVQPAIQHALSGGSFRPARGNILIVGDAAGLNVPVTGEGLNMALKSGLEAARAVAEAKQSGTRAAGIYLKIVDELLTRFQEIEVFGRRIGTAAATKDPEAYADALIESWDYALKAF